eukprot:g4074.t1
MDSVVSIPTSTSSTSVEHVEYLVSTPVATSASVPATAPDTSLWETTTSATQWLLEGLHTSTGLPWWGTIVTATLILRFSLFPFAYYNAATQHRLAETVPDMRRLNEARAAALYASRDSGLTGLKRTLHGAKLTLKFFSGCQAIWKKHGAHPIRRVIPLAVQLPCFILFALTWRKMIGASTMPSTVKEALDSAEKAGVGVQDFDLAAVTGTDPQLLLDLQHGGALWFNDLTIADSTMVLPFSVLGISYMSLHFAKKTGGATDGQFFPKLLDAFQVALISGLPVFSNMPAGVYCYMGTSATYGLLFGFAMRSSAFRKAVGLPHRRIQSEPKDISKK